MVKVQVQVQGCDCDVFSEAKVKRNVKLGPFFKTEPRRSHGKRSKTEREQQLGS